MGDAVVAGEAQDSAASHYTYLHFDSMTRDVWGWTLGRSFVDSVTATDSFLVRTARQVSLVDTTASADSTGRGLFVEDVLHEVEIEFDLSKSITQGEMRFSEKNRKALSLFRLDSVSVRDAIATARALFDATVAGMTMVHSSKFYLIDSVNTGERFVAVAERRIGVQSGMTEGEKVFFWKEGAARKGRYRVVDGVTIEHNERDLAVGRYKMRGE